MAKRLARASLDCCSELHRAPSPSEVDDGVRTSFDPSPWGNLASVVAVGTRVLVIELGKPIARTHISRDHIGPFLTFPIVRETHNPDHREIAVRSGGFAVVRPEEVTKVDDAFDSEVGWSVSFEGTDEFLEVDKDTWVNNTVVIPATVCNEV